MWAASTHVAVDGLLVGLRSDAADVIAEVERALGATARPGLDGPTAYSVLAGGPGVAGTRSLHRLAYGGCTLLHARERALLLQAFVQAAASHGPVPLGLVPCEAFAVVGTNGAVLGHNIVGSRLDGVREVLRSAEVRWVPGVRVLLDLATHELVVPDGGARFDRAPHPRDLQVVEPGRYPLVGWATWPVDASQAQLVVRFLNMLPLGPWFDRAAFVSATRLALDVPRIEVATEPGAIAAGMARLAAG